MRTEFQYSRNVNKTHRSNIFVQEPSTKSFDGLKLESVNNAGSSSFFGIHQDDGKKNLAKQESENLLNNGSFSSSGPKNNHKIHPTFSGMGVKNKSDRGGCGGAGDSFSLSNHPIKDV